MGLFSSKTNSYLGVDIGSASIKLVELKNESGRPRLITYGFVEDKVDIVHDDSKEVEERVANLLKQICLKAKVATDKTVAALPSFSVFSSVISMPQMSKKDLNKAVYWQAKKFVPMNLEEMTLDWKELGEGVKVQGFNNQKPLKKSEKFSQNFEEADKKEKESDSVKSDSKKDMKILIAASPKKLVSKYVNIFKRAELELLSLETEGFAMERSLVGGDKTPVMIVDIGSITSDISVVENGIPVLTRSVDAGGRTITQAVINSMNVDERRAEQFKRDIGFSQSQGNLPKVIEAVVTPIINEIKYCFELYASQQTNKRIEKIVLTGGSSFLPNIDQYLSQLLNIKVFIGDPWSRVIYPVELKPVLQELAPRFSVAVGLAMREII